ncbi:HalOD1 output domain-containing protein [Halosimplex pelagicum]|uniref:Halobacterial output domain-containing protein n=1 Tax=Halosimplex pelagicum TaxID=869886 RepID=A0A7D5PDX2_9EURY|nr:HalOD1 output domain-containing protein [Halosimplex pelagicum]QLH84038.1 hypothetical protein HZS54_21420 [Halosimplex pelagicum]
MNHQTDADATEAYEVELDSVDADSPSVAVIRTVAALTDTPLDSLDYIGETVDPDALDAILASGDDGGCRVTFRYEGYVVEVVGTERLRLRPAAHRSVDAARD